MRSHPTCLQRLSTANDEIVEVLLSKHQVLAALRFIRSVGTLVRSGGLLEQRRPSPNCQLV